MLVILKSEAQLAQLDVLTDNALVLGIVDDAPLAAVTLKRAFLLL
jgi:hypothetical protein